jgi:ribose transport system substrate-binding protein
VRRITAITLALLCCAGMLVACGDDDGGNGNGDGGTAAAGPYGTGLELGEKVLRSSPVGAAVGPWYRWNSEKCSFETTEEHPAEYKADVREVVGGESRIGYMHYGNSDTFGVANSESVEEVAKLAGMELDVYNLKFPSRTEPLSHAQTAAIKGDKGVLQANLDPSILPQFYKRLEGDGCIPSIQMYIPVDDHPAMGANWPDVGAEIGAFVAEEAADRGWEPEQTALVQCTDPDNGPTVNILFEKVSEQVVADGFAIPEENQFDLVCKLTESQSGEKRVTDWFTSHPDFEHVVVTSIDSPRMQSIIKAVEREGRPREDVILADTGLDPADQKSVRAGDQDLSVAFFPEKYGDWLIPMLQDVMAGNPVPKFVGTELVRGTPETIDDIYPQG